MKLAVIAPGKATRHRERAGRRSTPAPWTATTAPTRSYARPQPPAPRAAGASDEPPGSPPRSSHPQPVIYSRAQWGADESIRGKSSLHYGDVHAGFVHHTVNANDYTRAEVPGIIRSIYAYHVKSRGWSDIGYNYLVDRFGRIWEGRYGGVDRPVVGAHTLGYNDDSFAAVGHRQLPDRQAQHGDDPGLRHALRLEALAARRRRRLHPPVGHQEVVPGDQRPPRRRGHALPGPVPLRQDPEDPEARRRRAARVVRAAAGVQPGLDAGTRTSSYDGPATARRSSSRPAGCIQFPPAGTVATGAAGATQLVVSPDITGDGRSDLLVRQADGSAGGPARQRSGHVRCHDQAC